MPRRLAFLVPLLLFVGIVVAGAAMRWWTLQPPPRGAPVLQELGALHPSEPFVRVQGTAHYPVVITQQVPGGLFGEDRVLYLFPLFAEGEVEDRAIRVLVRTERKPERFVSYEVMAVEGRVVPVTPDKVPYDTEIELGRRAGYFFSDGIVLLEPWRIEVEGEEAWEAP